MCYIPPLYVVFEFIISEEVYLKINLNRNQLKTYYHVEFTGIVNTVVSIYNHGQPQYILISEPGQPFRSQFVLYRPDIGLIKQTLNRTSRWNKVDAVRLYASYRLNFTKGAEVRAVLPIQLGNIETTFKRSFIRCCYKENSFAMSLKNKLKRYNCCVSCQFTHNRFKMLLSDQCQWESFFQYLNGRTYSCTLLTALKNVTFKHKLQLYKQS